MIFREQMNSRQTDVPFVKRSMTFQSLVGKKKKQVLTSTKVYSFLLAVLWNGYFSVKKEKKLM